MYALVARVSGYTKRQLAEVKLGGEMETQRGVVGGCRPLSIELLKQTAPGRSKT